MKFLLGMATGILISAIVSALFLYPSVKTNWRNQGINEGSISARAEIAEVLRREFEPNQEGKVIAKLFDVKATSVLIVETSNGKKSIKVHE